MYQAFLDEGLTIVKQAGEIAMKYFNGKLDMQTEIKIDGDSSSKHHLSPVTIADKEIETHIKSSLSQIYPTHGFIGEEQGESNTASEYVRIIDPIDGTKAFSRHMYDRAILLALQYKGNIVVGISYMPCLNEMLYATEGGGAFCNGEKIEVSSVSTLNKSYICTDRHKYFTRDNLDVGYYALCEHVQYYGSKNPYVFHALAKGSIEAVLGPKSYIYDIAPYLLITQRAGGKTTTIQGRPITENYTTYCCSNGYVHDKMISFFSNVERITLKYKVILSK